MSGNDEFFDIRARKNPCRRIYQDQPFTVPIDALRMFTVYDHPDDYPEHFVVREWLVNATGQHATRTPTLHDTIESARGSIPPGLHCIPRSPSDDSKILETWF